MKLKKGRLRVKKEVNKKYDSLAQPVEHLTFNQGVPSSSLGWVTRKRCIIYSASFSQVKREN